MCVCVCVVCVRAGPSSKSTQARIRELQSQVVQLQQALKARVPPNSLAGIIQVGWVWGRRRRAGSRMLCRHCADVKCVHLGGMSALGLVIVLMPKLVATHLQTVCVWGGTPPPEQPRLNIPSSPPINLAHQVDSIPSQPSSITMNPLHHPPTIPASTPTITTTTNTHGPT